MGEKKLLIAFFILCLSSFMLGSVETSGSEVIPRLAYGILVLGMLFLGFFSKNRFPILIFLAIGVVASIVGGWAKEIRYLSYFAVACLLGFEYGRKYPSLFQKVNVPYAALTGLVMMAQTLAISPFFHLWDNSYFFLEEDRIQDSYWKRYQIYQDLNLPSPFFNSEIEYSITQGRPTGLAYANNLACSLLLLGMVGLFTSNKNNFPKLAYLYAFPIILSGGLLTFLGAWFLATGRFFFFPNQRRACLWYFGFLVGMIVLYGFFFPGLADGRTSSQKIVSSFTTRATHYLDGSEGGFQEAVEACEFYLLQFSNLTLVGALVFGTAIMILLLKTTQSIFPTKYLIIEKFYPVLVYLSTLFFVPMHRNVVTYFFISFLVSYTLDKSHKNFIRH